MTSFFSPFPAYIDSNKFDPEFRQASAQFYPSKTPDDFMWLSWLGVAGLVAAVALYWLGGLALLIALASVASLGFALRAHLRAPWLQPTLTADRFGRTLTLLGVHDRFAAAVTRHHPVR